MPRRPSELLELHDAGWDAEARLDFDLGFLWFDSWIAAKRNEQVYRKPDKNDGKVGYPKYESLNQIFALYDRSATPGDMIAHQQETRREIDDLLTAIIEDTEPTF